MGRPSPERRSRSTSDKSPVRASRTPGSEGEVPGNRHLYPTAVVGILIGQHRGDDPAGIGVRREMQHSPGPAPLGAMLLGQPLARAAELQSGAVHQQVAPAPSPPVLAAPPASRPGG